MTALVAHPGFDLGGDGLCQREGMGGKIIESVDN